MTKDEALRMALEALEEFDRPDDETLDEWLGRKAITAIREVLAQPEEQTSCSEQKPVAWIWEKSNYPESRSIETGLLFNKTDNFGDVDWTPLYTSPPKPWVGLTDEEKEELDEKYYFYDIPYKFMDELEAKLKEKNT